MRSIALIALLFATQAAAEGPQSTVIADISGLGAEVWQRSNRRRIGQWKWAPRCC